jgi:amidase
MIRSLLVLSGSILAAAIVNPDCKAAPMTATEIQKQFASGVSASVATRKAMEKIEATDDDYHAVIVSGGPAVVTSTRHLDGLSPAERVRLPLGGVPILVKDNIETIEWPTTAGSLALTDNLTGRDADLISRLRESGAVILGKANLSEWANFRSEKSISGWSGIRGQTRNAFDVTRSPCGSSSGPAVSVALGYVPVAIGSETDGSIVCPASLNGVVGFKPTHGLVSGFGIVPIAATQDTAGPIATNVIDAAITLGAMIDIDGNSTERNTSIRTKLLALKAAADLKGKRIGILSMVQGFDARRDELLEAAIATLESLGAEVVPGLVAKPYDGYNQDEYDVLLYEFKHQLNDYLAGLPTKFNQLTLTKLIQFNNQSDIELSLFDQGIFLKANELPLTEVEYQQKLGAIRKAAREDGLDHLIGANKLDVLIGTTGGPAWTIDDVNGDTFHGPSISSFPAVGGHPHLTVPMGDIRGLPIGLSFIGRRFDDVRLAATAAVYEANRKK